MAKEIGWIDARADDNKNIIVSWSIQNVSKQMDYEDHSLVYKKEELESALSKVSELYRTKLTQK